MPPFDPEYQKQSMAIVNSQGQISQPDLWDISGDERLLSSIKILVHYSPGKYSTLPDYQLILGNIVRVRELVDSL